MHEHVLTASEARLTASDARLTALHVMSSGRT